MEPWGAALFGNPCRECGFDWSIMAGDAVAWMSCLDRQLADVTAQAHGTERRDSGGWSVTEYVCHVGDNLRQWAERVQCARLSHELTVAGYEPNALAQARGYASLSLAAAVWSTEVVTVAWVSVLAPALAEDIRLQHPTRGLQSADDIARNNCHDAYHHLWDIREIVKRRSTKG